MPGSVYARGGAPGLRTIDSVQDPLAGSLPMVQRGTRWRFCVPVGMTYPAMHCRKASWRSGRQMQI